MLCKGQVFLSNYWQVTLWNKVRGEAIVSLIQLNTFLDEKQFHEVRPSLL